MRSKDGYSLLELLVVAALASILLMSLAEVYQWSLKNYLEVEYVYDRLNQIILADTQLRYQLNHRDHGLCADSSSFSVRAYQNTVPISTSLQLAPDSDCLQIISCRKTENSYRMVKTYFFIAKNNQDKNYSLYEKIEGQNAQRIVPGIENIQLLFGMADMQAKNIHTYLTPNQILDWNKVASVFLQLHLTSVKSLNLPTAWNIYVALQK